MKAYKPVLMVVLLVFLMTSWAGCKEAELNLVNIWANPEEVTTGDQSQITVTILDSSKDGHKVQFMTTSGKISGGQNFDVIGGSLSVLYAPDAYFGSESRLDTVYVTVSSLKTAEVIGTASVIIKVVPK